MEKIWASLTIWPLTMEDINNAKQKEKPPEEQDEGGEELRDMGTQS